MMLKNATQKHPNIHLYGKSLLDIFAQKYKTDKNTLVNGYVRHYEQHLGHLKYRPIRLLEFGVHEGRSHLMWADYFLNGEIYGIDISESARSVENDRIHVSIGDLDDPEFVQGYIRDLDTSFDIIIDDASHTMRQQQANFLSFFHVVKPGGIYVVEDTGTSYWNQWGGGYRRLGTTIEFLKGLVDNIHYPAYKDYPDAHVFNGHHAINEPASYWDQNIYSLNFYKYICFIYKTPGEG